MLKILFLFFLFFINGYAVSNLAKTEAEVNRLYHDGDDDALYAYVQSLSEGMRYYYMGCLSLYGFMGADSKLANFYFFKCLQITKSRTLQGLCYKALGDSFYSGDGLDECLNLAMDYYKKSADHSNAAGLFNYAVTLRESGNTQKAILMMKKYLHHKQAELHECAQRLLREWQHALESRR
ncbi:MAG: hypothetical protein CNLJKLNK_00558 [Holosporales bacterium]